LLGGVGGFSPSPVVSFFFFALISGFPILIPSIAALTARTCSGFPPPSTPMIVTPFSTSARAEFAT
jgi:hypothetical protein